METRMNVEDLTRDCRRCLITDDGRMVYWLQENLSVVFTKMEMPFGMHTAAWPPKEASADDPLAQKMLADWNADPTELVTKYRLMEEDGTIVECTATHYTNADGQRIRRLTKLVPSNIGAPSSVQIFDYNKDGQMINMYMQVLNKLDPDDGETH